MTDDLKIIELQELLDNANSQYKTVSAEAGRYKLLAEKLEQQLAECQAALQLRDKVLRGFRDSVLFRIGSSSPYRILAEDYFEQIKETIAIQPGTGAQEQWLSDFPELNTNNYSHEDVCRLNDWGISLVLSAKPKSIS